MIPGAVVKFQKPSKELERWREAVRGLGSIISHQKNGIQIHHPIGRTAKVKGVGNVGHFFILPLTHWEHTYIHQGKFGLDVLRHDWLAFNNDKHDDEMQKFTRLDLEKFLFARVCNKLDCPSPEAVTAIMDYRK
tara:strand:- start:574 stop:975 length:402 start_codon:yes stop_codon:yes gene_type:complete